MTDRLARMEAMDGSEVDRKSPTRVGLAYQAGPPPKYLLNIPSNTPYTPVHSAR